MSHRLQISYDIAFATAPALNQNRERCEQSAQLHSFSFFRLRTEVYERVGHVDAVGVVLVQVGQRCLEERREVRAQTVVQDAAAFKQDDVLDRLENLWPRLVQHEQHCHPKPCHALQLMGKKKKRGGGGKKD